MIDFLNRPVMQLPNEEWRGLIRGQPVEPVAAFGYIHRAMRQTLPVVMGAMRLLSLSFSPETLNNKGYGLYCEFRPSVEGWGKRAEMRIADILALRPGTASAAPAGGDAVAVNGKSSIRSTTVEQGSSSGRPSAGETTFPARERTRSHTPGEGSPSPPAETGAAEAPEPSPKRARRLTLDEYLEAVERDDVDVEAGAGAPEAAEPTTGSSERR